MKSQFVTVRSVHPDLPGRSPSAARPARFAPRALRSVLFALIAVSSACGGDRSPATSGGDARRPALATPTAKPEPIKAQMPEPTKPMAEVAPAAPSPVPTTYAEALAQGKAQAASGQHARARELFEAAARFDRKAAEPHIELARLFITSGERALAIRAAGKAVKLAPSSSQAYNTLGRAELSRFRYDDAIIAFRQATELDPDNVWAWNNLGYTHLQLAQYREAADALAEATSRKGTEGYMWNNLGTALEHLDELDDARDAYDHGGKLGSREALASRKRLEGVDTIVVMRSEKPGPDKPAPATSQGYELSEPMPEPEPEAASDADAHVEPVDAEDTSADDASTDDTTTDDTTTESTEEASEKPEPSPAL
jgi:Flp pilus assembly protein TadD